LHQLSDSELWHHFAEGKTSVSMRFSELALFQGSVALVDLTLGAQLQAMPKRKTGDLTPTAAISKVRDIYLAIVDHISIS